MKKKLLGLSMALLVAVAFSVMPLSSIARNSNNRAAADTTVVGYISAMGCVV